jgi:hypothetical protein
MNIEAFDHILLEDTFVLSWHRGPTSLTFHVLASLLQSHPEATTPHEGEWAYYKPGIVHFAGVTSVNGLLSQSAVQPTTDADGCIDYGCIDELSVMKPGAYRISGEFGVVTMVAEGVSLLLGNAV